METFTQLKKLAENPHFQTQKENCLRDLTDEMIDGPIVDLINRLNTLPFCFTLQSCYGHFVYNGKESHHLDPLPTTHTVKTVEYRIAYIAFCIEKSASGRNLLAALNRMPAIDPGNIEFGCAEWFWERQINSYALQVEPHRFKHQDTAVVDLKEALHIEKIRNEFYIRLYELLERRLRLTNSIQPPQKTS